MNLQTKRWIFSIFLVLISISPAYAKSKPVNPKILHIINRLSFGAAPGDIQKVQSMGIEKYIQQQLNPDSIPESKSLTRQISQMKTLNMNSVQRKQYIRNAAESVTSKDEKKQARREKNQRIYQETIQSRLLRATSSHRQLQEVMVDFWYNHFNVNADQGKNKILVGAYEQEAIRPYAMGRFRDLLGATAQHPAMLVYLDNAKNRVSNRRNAKKKAGGLNENYARELMELHTLGVDGGYTQQDITALAKIFSGWGVVNYRKPGNSSGFKFNSKHHDFSDKVFLGHKIKGTGKAEGEAALDILASSPATARHISYKLAQYFVSDRPPETLVKKLSQRYLATDGNIRAVLNTLFQSSEFWDRKNFNSKFKTPYQYTISVVRATGIEIKNPKPILKTLNELSMPLYRCRTPDGYKNTQEAWLNPDAMTRRLNFALSVAQGRSRISILPRQRNRNRNQKLQLRNRNSQMRKTTKTIPVNYEQLMITLGNSFSSKTQKALNSSPEKIRAGLILGSPEFMRR